MTTIDTRGMDGLTKADLLRMHSAVVDKLTDRIQELESEREVVRKAVKAEWSAKIRMEMVNSERKNYLMLPTKTMVELLELFEGRTRKGMMGLKDAPSQSKNAGVRGRK